jgi:HlyD family secretion protein
MSAADRPRSRPRARVALTILALLAACRAEPDALHLVGTVERTEVELVAPLSETIVAIHAERGETVARDQLVLELDPTYARVEVARAEATLAGARTGELVARQELERAERLHRGHVLSAQERDRTVLARDEARARVREAEATLAAAHKREADLELRSPVDGVLDQIPFDSGERVPAGAVLAVILAHDEPWVRVWVPENRVVRILPRTPAELRIDGIDATLHGSVLDVSRDPEFTPHYALTERDRVHLVYETRVRIHDAPPELRPGIPAQVRILAPDHVATARP